MYYFQTIVKKELIVFTPGITAFYAAEESDLAFIGRTKLTKPPFSKTVTAFGTFDLNCRKSDIIFFFAVYDNNLFFLNMVDLLEVYLVV